MMTKHNNINNNKNPFEVPDGYFDSLPGLIQNRLEKRKGFFLSLFEIRSQQWQYKVIAISFLILLSAGLFFILSNRSSNTDQYANEIGWEDIIDNNNNLLIEFDESILIESLIAEADNNEERSMDISSDDIIDYLIEEENLDELVYDL
jgi:hypothetical protein